MLPLVVVLVLLGLVLPPTWHGYHPRDVNSAAAVERAPVLQWGPDVVPQPTLEPNRAPDDPLPEPPWALSPQRTSAQPQLVPASTAGDDASGRTAEALTAIHPSRAPPTGYLSRNHLSSRMRSGNRCRTTAPAVGGC